MKISESQRRRANNQIWNAAEDYDFAPKVRAYEPDGTADLYRNAIIGAVQKHFGGELDPLWEAVHRAMAEDICEQLVWIGLENACYEREKELRPAFPILRRNYARKMLSEFAVNLPVPYDEVYRLSLLHAAGDLSEEYDLPDASDGPGIHTDPQAILNCLLFPASMSGQEITEAALAFLDARTLLIPKPADAPSSGKHFHFKFLHRKKKTEDLPQLRPNGVGLMEHGNPSPSFVNTGKHYIWDMTQAQSDASIGRFIRDIWGTPLFSDVVTQKTEREICVGPHDNCHLYYALGDGLMPEDAQGYGAILRKNAIAQMARNRSFYRENQAMARTVINRLAERWQNAMMVYRQDNTVRADHGVIAPGRLWRLEKVNDSKVFDQTIPADDSEIYVDLLIDASLSQEERQMRVALQAYMIAEALTRCRIPVRVCSFNSVSGYTCLTRYRDYGENRLNDRIFNFCTMGGNRDGLGIRMERHLMETDGIYAEKRILIVLSDTCPNDSINMIEHGEAVPYKSTPAVINTANEVRALKNRGISVLCVYTGTDRDLPAAHQIYNRDFVRIRSVEDFAQAVGNLFLTAIRE